MIKSMLDPITSDGMVVRTSFFSLFFFFFVSLFCKLLLFVERCVAVRGMADTVTFQATDFRIVSGKVVVALLKCVQWSSVRQFMRKILEA